MRLPSEKKQRLKYQKMFYAKSAKEQVLNPELILLIAQVVKEQDR